MAKPAVPITYMAFMQGCDEFYSLAAFGRRSDSNLDRGLEFRQALQDLLKRQPKINFSGRRANTHNKTLSCGKFSVID